MITEKTINSLYKMFSKRPESPDCLDIAILFENLMGVHDIYVDDFGNLIIESLPPDSPFHKLSLSRINGIVDFEEWVAIVLNASIIFLDKRTSKVQIHIKKAKTSILDKIFHHPSPEI